MEESRRQLQVARLVKEALSDIFLKEAKEITADALVTIAHVKMTPDLFTARVYFSIYNTKHPDEIMHYIESNNRAIRGLLGKRLGKSMRRIPELVFFKDDTLDEVFKLEEFFKKMNEEKQAKGNTDTNTEE